MTTFLVTQNCYYEWFPINLMDFLFRSVTSKIIFKNKIVRFDMRNKFEFSTNDVDDVLSGFVLP